MKNGSANVDMNIILKQIVKTTAQWTSLASTVIPKDVLCVEECTDGVKLFKIGDGTTTWASLPYTSTTFQGVTYTLVTTEPDPFDPTAYYKNSGGQYVAGTSGEAWAANTWYTATGGLRGLVPTPAATDGAKFLRGDGAWAEVITTDTDARYRVVPTRNATTQALESFKLQVSVNGGTWTDVATSDGSAIYNVDLGLFTTSAAGNDEVGKIKSILLPSYVDDIVEGYYSAEDHKFYENAAKTVVITPKPGYIYVDITASAATTDHSFRWSGTTYVDITNPCDYETICSLLGLNSTNNGNFDGTGTSATTPLHGFVPPVTKSDTSKFLNNDGSWKEALEPSDNLTLQCVLSFS